MGSTEWTTKPIRNVALFLCRRREFAPDKEEEEKIREAEKIALGAAEGEVSDGRAEKMINIVIYPWLSYWS